MEMIFRKAGNPSQLGQFYRTIEVRSQIVDDPIHSLGIFR